MDDVPLGSTKLSALVCRAGVVLVLEVEAGGVLLGPNKLSTLVWGAGRGYWWWKWVG